MTESREETRAPRVLEREENESPQQESPPEERPETSRNLVWKCLTCEKTAPPTSSGYMSFIQHTCTDRKIWLIDVDSGEQLANNLKKAINLGLVAGSGGKPGAAPKSEEAGKEGEVTEPQVSSEGIFRYTISLPADAFTLFNLAKAVGLEKDLEKPFDEWVWDCITRRFVTDYKMQLILAPVEE